VQEILRAQDEPRESAQGNTLGPTRASGQGGESLRRSGDTRGGSRKGGDDADSQHASASPGGSSGGSSAGTTGGSNKNDSGSSGSSGESNRNDNSGNSSSGGSDTASGGNSPGNETNQNADKPDKPKDGKSQPVEGGASNRDVFAEMGVTNPGDRPKQQGRGSDDRNVPYASGVIIIPDRPRTPEEIKRMVTQPGVDGDARRAGGGGRLRDPWRFAQPPPGTDGSGLTPANPNIPGVTGPGADAAPSIPKPSDPAERK
jgi:hypothetical protein